MKSLLLACLVLPLALTAATFRVNNTPGTSADFTSINAAITAASDGDTILVEGSVSAYAAFTLSNKRLNIIGPGYGLNANPGTPANKQGAAIMSGTSVVQTTGGPGGTANGTLIMGLEFVTGLTIQGASNVTIARCYFNTNNNANIQVNGPNNRISQCFFAGTSQPILLGSGASGTTIENCLFPQISVPTSAGSPLSVIYFRNNLSAGLSESSSTPAVVENNIFIGAVTPQANSSYRNNLASGFFASPSNGSGNVGGVNLSGVMPAFSSSGASFDGRYLLHTTANAATNAGTDGTHIGPFGGANPYILSGIPPLPTIDELSVPQFASPGSPLIIRVKVSERP